MLAGKSTEREAARLKAAWVSVCIVGAAAIGMCATLMPGRAGAAGARLAALCMLAAFACIGYLRDVARYPGRRGPSPFAAVEAAGSGAKGRTSLWAATLFALSVATSLGVGAALDHLEPAFGLCCCIAGLVLATFAIVRWFKALERQFGPHLEDQNDAGAPAQPADHAFLAKTGLCAAGLIVGLGMCAGMRMTPLTDMAAWAVGASATCLTACIGCGALLFHIPHAARQLVGMQDLLVDTIQEKDVYRQQADQMADAMADLQAQHESALSTNEKLSRQVQSMRTERSNAVHDDTFDRSFNEACDAIIDDYKLTKREGDVLVLLARGHSRKQVADELVVEKTTVGSHVRRIYQKLNVHSSHELVDFVRNYR